MHAPKNVFPGLPVLTRGWQRFPRLGKLLLAIGLCLAALLLVMNGLGALPAPRLVSSSGTGNATIGARGPVTLVFTEPMQPESVETGFSIDPPVAGHFTWQGMEDSSAAGDRVVSFWPDQPLAQGQHYTVRLASGALGKSGRRLRKGLSWTVEVRPADIVYLSPSQSPEIWRSSIDGKSQLQLTTTGGNIYDYCVSTDGNLIAYSVKNEQQGYDLWKIDRDGKNPQLLLPCGTDWCTGPAYSPDGAQIAYSRRKYSGLPGRQPDAPQIWLLDRASQVTGTLVADPDVGGNDPAWSPDGRFLAFYDGLAGGVFIYDLNAQNGFLVSSEEGSGVAWSPDSRRLLYTQIDLTAEVTENTVYEVDVQTRKTRRVLGDPAAPADYSVPEWAPDGEWIAVGWRLSGGSANRQLWLVHLDGGQASGERRSVTADEAYTHASYHWDPGGTLLVFQRLAMGAARNAPQIMVWNQQDGKSLLLADDAFHPHWMP